MAADEMLAWLKATIEADKVAAEKNGSEVWLAAVADDSNWLIKIEGGGSIGESCGCCVCGTMHSDEAAHIAIHDPRDTIARCEAELKLLDEHQPIVDSGRDPAWPAPGHCLGCRTPDGEDYQPFPCATVRLLATGRRHRPGFKPEWVER